MARPICLLLERHDAARAFSRACAKTGKRMAAKIAIMAMTTSSSIRVKPRLRCDMLNILLDRLFPSLPGPRARGNRDTGWRVLLHAVRRPFHGQPPQKLSYIG